MNGLLSNPTAENIKGEQSFFPIEAALPGALEAWERYAGNPGILGGAISEGVAAAAAIAALTFLG